jgi:ABC-type transporter Mla subunit MlaD
MTQYSFLKVEWMLAGINAPALIWVGALLLALFTVYMLIRLWWAVRREKRLHQRVRTGLERIRGEFPRRPGEGLAAPAFDSVVRLFESEPVLAAAWDASSSQVLTRRSADGDETFWSADSADAALSEEATTGSRLNRSLYVAIPGFVTGLGLLLTFVAILIALLDVRVQENQVVGLEGLVAGLSGKFVSSVVALLLASIFLLFERSLLHRLDESRHRLVGAIDAVVPRRTSVQALTDLHRDIEEQSTAFRHFNSDLSGLMKKSFSESMGPTLQQMANTIEELNQLLRAAEAQKQESITGSLEAMLGRLEESMRTTLDRMGQHFAAALSGGATQTFEESAKSLAGTGKLLADMNAQFQATQSALTELIDFARRSTAEQVALGRTQVEDLTTVLRQLMTQLEETTGSSVTRMTAALTGVVSDLSHKVSDLGDRMAHSMSASAEQASSAAAQVVSQADAWSARSSAQLAELLERHQSQVELVAELRELLEQTVGRVREALTQYATVTTDLQRVSADVTTVAGRAADATESMRQIHAALQEVARLSAAQVEHLAEANAQQEENWRRVQRSMEQYETTFGEVDRAAGQLLQQISDHLRDYTQTTKQGTEEIVKVSNELIANAVQKLGGAINELEEYLSELSDVLGRTRARA